VTQHDGLEEVEKCLVDWSTKKGVTRGGRQFEGKKRRGDIISVEGLSGGDK